MIQTRLAIGLLVLSTLGCSLGGQDTGEFELVETKEEEPEPEEPEEPEVVDEGEADEEPAEPAPAPKPQTRPAPRPKPEPKPRPASQPRMAQVTIEGDARSVWLLPHQSSGVKSTGGDTQPGAYKIKAWFSDPVPVIAGNITVEPGEQIVLTCSNATKSCTKGH